MLCWSWEDLRGAFYLFRLPKEWAPLFAFDLAFPAWQLGFAGQHVPDLASVVIPVGWRNAMGIVQYLHRRLLTQLGSLASGA